jgi:hypothetical protein
LSGESSPVFRYRRPIEISGCFPVDQFVFDNEPQSMSRTIT